jgi:hypothetical protein
MQEITLLINPNPSRAKQVLKFSLHFILKKNISRAIMLRRLFNYGL